MLSGTVVKAANVRQAAPFFVELAREYYGTSADPIHRSIVKVVCSLDLFYDVMFEGGMFLTAPELASLTDHLQRLGRHLMVLRNWAETHNLLLWQVTPKCHYQQHIDWQSRLINARFLHNYSQESLMGDVADIWSGCCAGPHDRTIQKHAMTKYMLLLSIVLGL